MRGLKVTNVKPHLAKKAWVLVDAEGQVLGRLASRLAGMLRGKHLPSFTPHADQGNVVVVVNVEKIRLTGNKLDQKFFKRYSGYPGGLKLIAYRELMAKRPERALRRAVWGMLPHSRMGRKQIRALKMYHGTTHPHVAQAPSAVKLEVRPL